MKTAKACRIGLLAGLILAGLFLAGCRKEEPVKIGFIGGLTDRFADLGTAGRNGVILAIEQANQNGGIHGRPLELLVRDDQQNPQVLLRAANDLVQAGVAAIIGPLTSSMATELVPLINKHQLLTLGPTISTNELTGLDDYFFRIYAPSRQHVEVQLRYARKMNYRAISVIYDTRNRSHTESWYLYFKQALEQAGGEIVTAIDYLSTAETSFSDLAEQVLQKPADCLLILASAMDTAMLCQQFAKAGRHIPIIASEWSATDELLKFGGKTVEGLVYVHTLDRNCQAPPYLEFVQRFQQRFGSAASFAAVHGYDCANIIITALRHNPDPTALKQTLLDIGSFQGLQTTLEFDVYGDIVRPPMLFEVRNGAFVLLER